MPLMYIKYMCLISLYHLLTLVSTFVQAEEKRATENSFNTLEQRMPPCAKHMAQLLSMQGVVRWRSKAYPDWSIAQRGHVFCVGDSVRVDSLRATLKLANATLVRLNEGALVKFAEERPSFLIKLLQGAAYFISRTPEKFDVEMPYINAAIEGTEFLLVHSEQQDTISVFEGKVAAHNKHHLERATAGQKIVAVHFDSTVSPSVASSVNREDPLFNPQNQLRISSGISLRGEARWTLYFPPLISLTNVPKDIIQKLYRNEFSQVYALLNTAWSGQESSILVDNAVNDMDVYTPPATEQRSALLALHVSLALYFGEYIKADTLIAQLAIADPVAAASFNIVVDVAAGNVNDAVDSSVRITESYPQHALSFLTQSYALQARHELLAAYEAADRAVQLAHDNPFMYARLAELAMSVGKYASAEWAVQQMLAINADLPSAHLFHGLLALTNNEFHTANILFTQALQLDPSNPLAHFCLGLTAIRLNKLEQGRSSLEVAVLLDPSNSVLRSYLGKAYSAEHRNHEAKKQFDLAQQLDSHDPTHWLYRALMLKDEQYYLAAHHALEESMVRNDQRAVFRSRLQLDADAAVRSANLGSIYREIGWDDHARTLATQAILTAPSDYSGHKLLAESLINTSRQEVAAASELLQAQIRQPLTARPLRSLLAEQNLFVASAFAPHQLGFQELSPLFSRNGLAAEVAVATGPDATYLTDAYVTSLYDTVALSGEYFNYSSDGFSDGYQRRYDIGNIYVQKQFDRQFKMFVEGRSRKENRHTLNQNVSTNNTERFFSDTGSLRLGVHYFPQANNEWLFVFNHIDDNSEKETENFIPSADISLINNFESNDKINYADMQTVWQGNKLDVITGASLAEIDRKQLTLGKILGAPIDAAPSYMTSHFSTRYDHGYVYVNSNITDNIQSTVGISFVDFTAEELVDNSEQLWNKKIGIRWSPVDILNIRAAFFNDLKKPIEIQQSLEPTHIQGFSQFHDDASFVYSSTSALAIEWRMSSQWRWQVEGYRRNLDWSRAIADTSSIKHSDISQRISNTGIYWLGSSMAYHVLFDSEKQRFIDGRVSSNLPLYIDTRRVENSLITFFGDGNRRGSFGLDLNYVHQLTKFNSSLNTYNQNNENFWLLNAELKYKFCNRNCSVSLKIENITGQNFSYQDKNILDGTVRSMGYIPERTALVRFTLSI